MRMFIGIEPTPAFRAAAEELSLRCRLQSPGKYVDPSLYHITLCFLGDLTCDQIESSKLAMQEIALEAPLPEVSTGSAGFFGRKDKAILYMDIKNGQALSPLAEKLRAQLDKRALPYDPQPFRAHLTLARGVDFSKIITPPADDVSMQAARITLFHSTRVDGILRYLPVFRKDL